MLVRIKKCGTSQSSNRNFWDSCIFGRKKGPARYQSYPLNGIRPVNQSSPSTFFMSVLNAHSSLPLSIPPLHVAVTSDILLIFVARVSVKAISATSVKHHHRLIFKALKDAVKWQLLMRNVAESVTPPKTKKVEMQIWDNEKVKTFLEESKYSSYYPIYLTAIFTGMRRGEVLGLRWQDIDFQNNIIYVRQSLQEVKKVGLTFKEPKSGKSRSISITSNLTLELKKLYEQQLKNKLLFGSVYNDLDLVFAQKNGKPFQPTELARNYRKMVNKSGLPYIRFHDLRHTHATLMLQQGIHPKVVSERLGHSTIGITMDTYTHVLPNMQKDAAHQFELLIK
jgi:integrase